MMRRFWLGLALGCATMLAAATGCQPRNQWALRQSAGENLPPNLATEVQGAASEDMAPPKGFFKNSRLPGGWSSQANEIERDLGVMRP